MSFQGTGVALVTPFKNGDIDFTSLGNVIDHCIKGQVDFLVSLGTTGETPALSANEQQEVLSYTASHIDGRVPLVAGVGGNNTMEVCHRLKSMNLTGVDAILSASPSYNKPSQEGIFQHFMEIQAVSTLPIILYNVPGRTSSNMTADTTLRLANASSKFIAIKEASGNLNQCMELVQGNTRDDFYLLSGDDNLTYSLIHLGFDGVISVIANAYPSSFSSMVRSSLNREFKRSQQLHYAHLDMINALFLDGNPGGVKKVMSLMNLCENELRLPLVPVNEKVAQQLEYLHSTFQTHP